MRPLMYSDPTARIGNVRPADDVMEQIGTICSLCERRINDKPYIWNNEVEATIKVRTKDTKPLISDLLILP